MSTDLVTGGTGFVGGHVVEALVAAGRSVRCLVRPGSGRRLAGAPVELVSGDLREPASLPPALEGVDTVYHCAADYRLGLPDPRPLHETNVSGTEHLLRAAAEAGVRRVVHTSSVGALGLRRDGIPADEATPVSLGEIVGPYKRSKYDAEQVALRWCARGLPVVIVNPSTPVGERDGKPTPTGRIIVDFLNGGIPAYVDTGLNLVDVRDVAAGHLLAAARGRPGERYILGHRNLSFREMLEMLARLAGRRPPRLRLPHVVPLAVAAVDEGISRLLGRTPRISLEAVRMSAHHMYFDASKAVRELALPQSPVEEALARAIAWFRDNGYARA
ncbi:MAG TPA: hopanoid-associated sugar epimerase [Vicinamibacteria bacterium]|nr:hopanoid-associated sugar epimerase [Vicinamibacteria bacterium]